jgi:hypothetical protein
VAVYRGAHQHNKPGERRRPVALGNREISLSRGSFKAISRYAL